MSTDPWTVYWQGDNLESCISTRSHQDSSQIAGFWRELAVQLDDASSVLDLASGNGAVPTILLSTNSTLKICAVDKAQIAPRKYLSQVKELASVQFMPDIDICDLPFAANSFDAVTSQFGLEYAPLTVACHSAARVLASQGKIRLLMHHQDSEILRPTSATLAEISRLFESQGVMAGIESFLADEIDLTQLEAIGQRYLSADEVRTRQLSGQIFSGINQIIQDMKIDGGQARTRMANMKKRLLADQARLQQLRSAALSSEQAHHVEQTLRESEISIDFFKPFSIADDEGEEILIGWQLTGTKK